MIIRALILAASLTALPAPLALAKETGRAEVYVKITDNLGGQQFCAGETVHAIPVSSKSTKLMQQIYGATDAAFASIYATPELIIRREGIDYVGGSAPDATRIFRRKFQGQKRGECDSADTARFEELPPGEYYLVIPVFWKRKDLPDRKREVSLRGGGQNEIYVQIPINYRGGTYLVRTTIAAGETTAFNLENEMVDTAPE